MRVKMIDDAIGDAREAIIVNDDEKQQFLSLADTVMKLFKAILPDPLDREFAPVCGLVRFLARKIRSMVEPADISQVMKEIEKLLDIAVYVPGKQGNTSRKQLMGAKLRSDGVKI